ncbi:TolC family protein [candidate division KSB1 bacterium]|nr:TolC family protein [candidate division KSB1 bacterium]
MKFKYASVLLIPLFSVGTQSFSQELLTLNDAIGIALNQNPWIQVSRNTAEITQNNAHIGNAGMLPQVNLSSGVNYSDNETDTNSGLVNSTSSITTAAISASMTVFNGFGNLFTFRKLKSAADIGELTARNNIENELLNVIFAFYGVARADEQQKIAQESVTISSERYERVKKRGAFGQANKIAILNAEVDLSADSISYYNAELAYSEAHRNLNTLLNHNIDQEYTIDDQTVFTQEYKLEYLQQKAFQQNAGYRIYVNNVKQSTYDLRIAQAGYLPKLSVSSSYGYSQNNDDFAVRLDAPTRGLTASATLSLNLFDGFQRRSKRQNAQLSIENQKLLLQDARLALEQELKNTFASYENSRYILAVQQRNLESAQLNFERTRELYELGQVTSTQFREAQLNLIRAKNNISNARFDAKLYEYELLKLSGELVQENVTSNK